MVPKITIIESVSKYIFCILKQFFCCIFFGGLKFVGHSFASVAHFAFLRDVWIRIQRAAVASRRATNLATPSQSQQY
jgi:hypothetical protein